MPPQISETASTADVVGQLAHDLRQPLSSLEAVTYHLDMILANADPEVRLQFDRLRQLLDQAGWILDDAVNGVQAVLPSREVVVLADAVRGFASEHALRDEHSLNLHLEMGSLEIVADPRVIRRILETSVQFLRAMAHAIDPISIRLSSRGGRAHLTVNAETRGMPAKNLIDMLDPKTHRTGSLRLHVESLGGALQVSVVEGLFAIEIALPLAH